MEFFKPTRRKIITAVILLLLLWITLTVRSFFEVSLAPFCLPILSGSEPAPAPLNLSDIVSDLAAITAYHGLNGYKGCPPYAPSYKFAYSIYFVSKIILPVIVAYITSCIITFLVTKVKKQKKYYAVKSKK